MTQKMHRRTSTGIVAVAFAVGFVPLCAAATPAYAADATVALTGHMDGEGGFEAGRVTARVWPSAQILAALPEDAAYVRPVVAVGEVTADGHYSIRIDPNVIGSDFRSPDDTVSLQFAFSDGRGEEVTWDQSLTLISTASGPRWVDPYEAELEEPATGSSAAVETFADHDVERTEVATEPARADEVVRRTDRLSVSTASRLPASAKLPQAQAQVVSDPIASATGSYCATISSVALNNRKETYGRALGWSGAKVEATETSSSKDTLGAAVKFEGQNWKASGSDTIEMTDESTRTVPNLVNKALVNRVNYREITERCIAYRPDGSSYYAYNYYRKAVNAHSLLNDGDLVSVPAVNWSNIDGACSDLSSGTFVKNTARNRTQSLGVDLGVIGVSAQSGWSRSTSLKHTFTARTQFCGSTASGPASSPEVEGHKWPTSVNPCGPGHPCSPDHTDGGTESDGE